LIPYFSSPSIRLGPFELSTFGLLAAVGVYMAVWLVSRASAKQGLDQKLVYDYALWGVVGGVVFGHLVHLFAYHPEELSSPITVLKFWEGLSSFGGLLGGILAAILFFRIRRVPFSDYADAFALGVAPGWGVARLGCFTIHDHPGILSNSPLAVAFPEGARFDLGLFDAVLLFGIALVLHLLRSRRLLTGRLLAVLALLYAIGRFYFDTLRATDIAYADARYLGLTPAQYACFGLVAYAIWQFWTKRKGISPPPPLPEGREENVISPPPPPA
jgi:phosphatidylglycerol:prolipoprotein diacylglycerol transferase